MQKWKFFLCIFIFAAWSLIMFFFDKPDNKAIVEAQGWRHHFDSTEINGKITYIDRSIHNGDAFSTSDHPEDRYYVDVFFKGEQSSEQFRRFADPGDIVIKRQFADSFILKKGNKTYVCFFLK